MLAWVIPGLACMRQNSLFLVPSMPKDGVVVYPGWPHFVLLTSTIPGLACFGAELPLLAADHAKRRPLVTSWVNALLAHHVDHSLFGVLRAELRLIVADITECRPHSALRVTAPLVDDVDHAWLGVLGAELRLLAAEHAKARPSSAPSVTALFADKIDHSLFSMLGATKLFFLAADTAELWLCRAP